MTAAVGADVEALCSKCGDVWHVVVAKVGAQIVKVQCKECRKEHRYKSPHGAPAIMKQAQSLSNPRPARMPSAAAPKAPVERFEKPAVPVDLSKPARTYRASEHFEVGDRVDHPNFGPGVVEISEPGKVTVFFGSGRRVLVQAKAAAPASGLTRPKPFDHSNAAGGKRVGES